MSELPKKLDKEIRNEAKNRCGYCLGEQKYIFSWLEIEHIFPRSKGGKSDKENLWLACPFCNTFKGSQNVVTDPKTKRKVLILIRASKSGKIILNLIRTMQRLSAKLCADARLSLLSNLITIWLLQPEKTGLPSVGIRRKTRNL